MYNSLFIQYSYLLGLFTRISGADCTNVVVGD